MRITESCGCGARFDYDTGGDWGYGYADSAVKVWRRDHRHDPRPLAATESDETGPSGGRRCHPDGSDTAESQSAGCNTTASDTVLADLHGFGFSAATVVAKGDE